MYIMVTGCYADSQYDKKHGNKIPANADWANTTIRTYDSAEDEQLIEVIKESCGEMAFRRVMVADTEQNAIVFEFVRERDERITAKKEIEFEKVRDITDFDRKVIAKAKANSFSTYEFKE